MRGSDQTYLNARRSDLVAMLDQLTAQSRRLDSEIAQLEDTRNELRDGADKQRVAQDAARKRLESASMLAGTVPARGQGVTVTISCPHNQLSAQMVVDALAELRDAGAEAIELNHKVRVIANTYIAGPPGSLTASEQPLSSPLVIVAIGEARTLEEGLRFRGGIVSQVQAKGGTVSIERSEGLFISAVASQPTPRFAKPIR